MSELNQEKQGGSIWSMLKWIFYGVILIFALFSFFGKDTNSSSTTTETVEVLEPTEGVITTVDEVEADIFKISDEEIVPLKEDSRIVANYLDGTVDTFTLDEARLIDTTATSSNKTNYRNRMIRSVIIGGAMGYLMGRSMNSPLSRSSYRSDAAYNKSATTTRSRMTSTASRRTVTRPSTKSRTGYGSGKSTRSYGG